MITHVGGINAVADATCHLPEIPGDKKLTYIQFDMPLTAIDVSENLEKQIRFLQKLDDQLKHTADCGMQKQRKFSSSILA